MILHIAFGILLRLRSIECVSLRAGFELLEDLALRVESLILDTENRSEEIPESMLNVSEDEEHAREAVRLVLKKPRDLAQDRASYDDGDNGAKTSGHTFSKEFEIERMLACQGLVTDHTRPAPSNELCGAIGTNSFVGLRGVQNQGQRRANDSNPCKEQDVNSIFLEHNKVVENICAEPAGLPHFEGHCLQDSTRQELAELMKLVKQPRLPGCPSCAVVGSSGNVLSTQMGPAIDEHDVVIRFGCAPTTGFEPDVGSKTTHRFLYPEAISADGPDAAGEENNPCGGVVDWEKENSTALIRLYKPMDVVWWTDLLKGKDWHRDISEEGGFWRDVPETQGSDFRPPMMVLNPAWMERASLHAGLSLESVPSQGMMGVLLALSACSKVDIYGFGTETATGAKLDSVHMHYFE